MGTFLTASVKLGPKRAVFRVVTLRFLDRGSEKLDTASSEEQNCTSNGQNASERRSLFSAELKNRVFLAKKPKV